MNTTTPEAQAHTQNDAQNRQTKRCDSPFAAGTR